jgi:type IV pilus assembly protein PilB
MPLGRVQTSIVTHLAELGRLQPAQRDELLQHPQDLSGEALDRLLREEYRVPDFPRLLAAAHAYGMRACNVARFRVTPQTFERLPQEFCQRHLVLPVGHLGELLLLACGDPFDRAVADKVQEMTGRPVIRLLARAEDLREKVSRGQDKGAGFADVVTQISEHYGESGTEVEIKDEEVTEESGPIIQLSNRIVEEAYVAGASDIHIEPQEKEVVVRNRVDGVCYERLRLPKKVGPALVARLKIMCNLDISERRLPQDGRIVFRQYSRKGLDIDLRVSTAPLNYGEGMVMRILDKQRTTLPLADLGFSADNLSRYRACIREPHGMILHCGPTGSGKSMTLYSALNEINTPDLVIRTAEDPIEYTLPGINQMQMHRQIGLTFAHALRAFLRQDPDVILVGEIRDQETAGIAVEAALTGHLLLSTLHTNDAPTTVSRLTDMGIEPFLLSSSLRCVCAQRLLRRVCRACRVEYEPSARERDLLERALGWSGPVHKAHPEGCPKCGHNGYRGRVGIHELMVGDEELAAAINAGAEAAELKRIAMRNGMKTLHQDGLLKVREGVTTMEEALTSVPADR